MHSSEMDGMWTYAALSDDSRQLQFSDWQNYTAIEQDTPHWMTCWARDWQSPHIPRAYARALAISLKNWIPTRQNAAVGTDRRDLPHTVDSSTETTAPDSGISGDPRHATTPPPDYVLELVDISPPTDQHNNQVDAATFAPPQLHRSTQVYILLHSDMPMMNP